ncbi:thiosulfate/3-mercaptopyruvate sulfurtransferase [Caldalkalibacillus uzonensis]|uniref:Thiosulfate/3-mercaptopyruvate sulfurtransferase n=1 Tax=Caldalkalibacillus uzonensis TaxID=353224 RepID=A0ABU0CNG5_9BACI|nr:sulfurtransferase [Caldalkalibacillus uzonensis]MDQ0337692.1 thiosulfate/3-mercaptopyruvate sulfurtransferase [Caldalkalibacillus uzonensis]
MSSKTTVSFEWLKFRLDDPQVIIADCRFVLGQPEAGAESYQHDHIPRAVYFDLEKDLSGPVKEHGGRHPLPDLDTFADKLGRAGIDETKTVVAYDDQGGAMAARLWWMLKYVGHDCAYLLEKPYSAWKNEGYPVTDEVIQPTPAQFTAKPNQDMIAAMEEVKQKLHDPDVIFIDARAKERYTGEQEPIDRVGGHIPGAVNEFWMEGLAKDGSWKTPEAQRQRLSRYLDQKDKELIVYCGSGVTACANIVAFHEVGLHPKLYVGSWSDWITYEDNEIETGDNGERK